MKKIILSLALLVGVLIAPLQSSAGLPWGYGCCCPCKKGCCFCGTIPCDNSCAGSALRELGNQVANSINEQNQAYQDVDQELKSGIKDTISMTSNIMQRIYLDQNHPVNGNLHAMEGTRSMITGEYVKNTTAKKHITDMVVNELRNADIHQTQVAHKINLIKEQGASAQPILGSILSDSSKVLEKGYIQHKQYLNKILNETWSYYNEGVNTKGSSLQFLLKELINNKGDDIFQLMPINQELAINEENWDSILKSLQMSLNLFPLDTISLADGQSHISAQYELNRKLYNAKLYNLHSLYLKYMARRKRLIDQKEWSIVYAKDEIDLEHDKISLMQFYQTMVDGRLMNPVWVTNMSELNLNGLDREMLYMDSISNYLWKDYIDLQNLKTNIYSQTIVNKLDSNRPSVSQ